MAFRGKPKPPTTIPPTHNPVRTPTLAPSRRKQMSLCPGFLADRISPASDAATQGNKLHGVVERGLILETDNLTFEEQSMVSWAIGIESELASMAVEKWGQENRFHELEIKIPFCKNKSYIDLVFYSPDKSEAIILDWKFGRNKQDEPEVNKQLSAYAVGVMVKQPTIQKVWLYVAYPRIEVLHGPALFELSDYEKTMVDMASELALSTVADYNQYIPGDHCGWCGRQPVCKKKQSILFDCLEVLGQNKEKIRALDFNADDLEVLGKLRKLADQVHSYFKSITEYTNTLHRDLGIVVPGYEEKTKRGTSSISDVPAAVAYLSTFLKRELGNKMRNVQMPDVLDLLQDATISPTVLDNYIDAFAPNGVKSKLKKKLREELEEQRILRTASDVRFLQQLPS